jgi:hypothetical protein
MKRDRIKGQISGPLLAVIIGVIGGLALLALVHFQFELGGPKIDRSGRLGILINGLPQRMARDVLLPNYGWVLQIRLPEPVDADTREGFMVMLRSERTGATIQIEDRFIYQSGENGENAIATLTIPKSLGLSTGLLSVRTTFSDTTGEQFEDSRRIRIRSWFGGNPIGERQVIHFDFEVDHDGDGVPDFIRDLERFGLASPSQPQLAAAIASRIEARAISRVKQAYDSTDDPNQTGRPRDPVHVLFRPTSDPRALVTRICVGGSDPANSDSVGHVRFDLHNEDKLSVECSDEPAAGLFPSELEVYRDAPLYRDAFGPFLESSGGKPFGEHPDDLSMNLDEIGTETQTPKDDDEPGRRAELNRAIAVFGDVLGSIMAHEAGHALGLVAPERPGVGLFGGSEGDAYAHNLDVFGNPPTNLGLMNAGRGFSFEELAGKGSGGPLRFRPLNYAYLRDRVVVSDKR